VGLASGIASSHGQSMSDAANAAFTVPIKHGFVRILDPVGDGSASLKGLLDPATEFSLAAGILIVASITLGIVAPPVEFHSWGQKRTIRTGRKLDGEQTVGCPTFSLLEGGLDFPIHIAAAVRATANEEDGDGGFRLDQFLPNAAHHIGWVIALDAVILVRESNVALNKD